MRVLNLSSFVLFVSDVAKSKEFYVTVLDQEVAMEVGALNIGFKSGLAIWDKAYATNTIFGSETCPRTDHECMEIYFETDGIDAMYEKVSGMDVRLVHAIRTQPWQQRVFRFYDPDGFIVEIGEKMDAVIRRLGGEGLSVDAIVEKTFMPKEIVQAVLERK